MSSGPGGRADNSPAFQRRVGGQEDSRPVGTVETLSAASRICFGYADGTQVLSSIYPPLKWRATVGGPSGTFGFRIRRVGLTKNAAAPEGRPA